MSDPAATTGVDAALERLERWKARQVHLQFVDIFGVLKSVTVPVARFASVVEHGEWFDGSAIDGFARVLEDDMYLTPDLATMAPVAWESSDGNGVARVMCDVLTPDGEPSPGDTRAVLRRLLEEADGQGLGYHVASEVEFFLFDGDAARPCAVDRAGYFDQSRDHGAGVREEIVDAVASLGVAVEGGHHEVAFGQHEIDIAFQPALAVADGIVLLRFAARAIAARHGVRASFMPKPLDESSGSGMHTHQGIVDARDGANLFTDPADRYGLSRLARAFIAGQLEHAPALAALTSPLVNSYKRLVSGYEAPTHVTWAHRSRSALIRVPRVSRSDAQATRVELRCPDPACNPYLAFAGMLAAGLDGVERELTAPPPLEEEEYEVGPSTERRYVRALPGSLSEALDALVADDVLVDQLGSRLVDRFVEAKRLEWEQYRSHVTDWEVERYLGLH
jgi:glutamine synthetase